MKKTLLIATALTASAYTFSSGATQEAASLSGEERSCSGYSGLVSFGNDRQDAFRRTTTYVAIGILKGQRPEMCQRMQKGALNGYASPTWC